MRNLSDYAPAHDYPDASEYLILYRDGSTEPCESYEMAMFLDGNDYAVALAKIK